MPDLKNVIKGLECCAHDDIGDCDNCPYNENTRYCDTQLMRDAIAMLKVQEPRVMTLKEINHLKYGSPYIIETNIPSDEPRLMYGLYSHKGMAGNYTFDTVDRRRNLFDVDYGKIWRCWTSRPTDEQRKATPWN